MKTSVVFRLHKCTLHHLGKKSVDFGVKISTVVTGSGNLQTISCLDENSWLDGSFVLRQAPHSYVESIPFHFRNCRSKKEPCYLDTKVKGQGYCWPRWCPR